MYTQTSAGEPRLVWKFEIEMKDNWYEVYVDVATGDLLRAVDWASDMSWTPKHVEELRGGKQKPLPAKAPEYATGSSRGVSTLCCGSKPPLTKSRYQ